MKIVIGITKTYNKTNILIPRFKFHTLQFQRIHLIKSLENNGILK